MDVTFSGISYAVSVLLAGYKTIVVMSLLKRMLPTEQKYALVPSTSTSVRETQSPNADIPIAETDLPMNTDERFLQPLKADSPTEVTPSDMVTVVRFVLLNCHGA